MCTFIASVAVKYVRDCLLLLWIIQKLLMNVRCWLPAVRQSPTKPKEDVNTEKKLEVEKHVDDRQNVVNASQTTKKSKQGNLSNVSLK